jgi:hypothetical protein
MMSICFTRLWIVYNSTLMDSLIGYVKLKYIMKDIRCHPTRTMMFSLQNILLETRTMMFSLQNILLDMDDIFEKYLENNKVT